MSNDKGGICVSVIIPLYHLSQDQKQDKAHIEKAINEVSENLIINYSTEAPLVLDKLTQLTREITFSRNDLGIGIYVSRNISVVHYFPFPVQETIVVHPGFRIKELLLKEQYAVAYFVLYIDERKARLFTGALKNVQELDNENFPVTNTDDYIYASPSRGTSYAGSAHVKTFENDKSAAKKKRTEAFLAEIDELLAHIIKDTEPIILCGPKRVTAAFLNRSNHANTIISVVNGNYEDYTAADFAQLTWPGVEKFLAEKMIDEVNEFIEKTGEGLTEFGPENIWDASMEGRIYKLLVEKDYTAKGYFVSGNPDILYMKEPKQDHTIIDNVIEDIIEKVWEKGGEISFLENNMLSNYQHIAAITRY